MLLLFDIDGTLTNTYGVDSDCYVSALRTTFGINNVDADWTTYPDATDSGILDHIFQTRFNRGPTIEEIARMIDSFQSSLANAFEVDPTRCKPIGGGPEFIASLIRDNIAFAVATGGWKPTANLKMLAAGLRLGDRCRYVAFRDAFVDASSTTSNTFSTGVLNALAIRKANSNDG